MKFFQVFKRLFKADKFMKLHLYLWDLHNDPASFVSNFKKGKKDRIGLKKYEKDEGCDKNTVTVAV